MLKQLTNTYLICKECFDLGNFPKVFRSEDFESTSLKELLGHRLFLEEAQDLEGTSDGEQKCNFSEEEIETLIDAVTKQQGEEIDWDSISKTCFNGKYSKRDCVFEFLRLPINKSLMLKFETSQTST